MNHRARFSALAAMVMFAAPSVAGIATESHLAPSPQVFKLSATGIGGELAWSPDRTVATTISVGPVPATGILVDALLSDGTTADRFANGDLKLCEAAQGACVPVTSLAANVTRRLYLRPSGDAELSPGKYVGTIQIRANEGASDISQMTIFVTDAEHKFLGVLAIAVGVLLSFGLTIGLRNRLAVDQLFAPAAALRDRLNGLGAALTKASSEFGKGTLTRTWLNKWHEKLDAKRLQTDGNLPSIWSLSPPSQADAQKYQQLLGRASDWTAACSHMVTLGFEPLARLARDAGADAARKSELQKAWTAVDAILPKFESLDQLAPDLASLDQEIAAAIAPAVNSGSGHKNFLPDRGSGPSMTESQHLHFQVTVMSMASWSIAALLTIAVGAFVMVINHLDFGRPGDFWLCGLWGLGFPSIAQLSQASPTTIAASIGVSLPKTG